MYQRSDLSNGLRVVSCPMKDRESAALGLWIGSGGRHETDRNKGVAHFLEHILFKGSKHYSCEQIKEKIEGVGGTLNAFTAEEQTCYFAKIPAKHLAKTFDILADMVTGPLIDKKDVEKERGVILEEIKMYHDLPQYYVLELLDELMWPNHPLGKNLAGSMETVGQMQSEDLVAFHQDHYFSGNVVVAACGQLDHGKLVKMVEAKMGAMVPRNPQSFRRARNDQEAPKSRLQKKDIEQMHLALGMFGLNYDHKEKYALALLNIVLGGNMSSRLFDQVREKRGLAYSISSSTKFLKDTGMLLIRAGVDNKKIVPAVELILKELKKIKRDGVTQSEFKRARDYLLGQMLLGLEDTLDQMFWVGESTMVRNRVRTIEEVVAEVEKVKKDALREIASVVIQEQRLNLSVVGPLTGDQERKLTSLLGA